MPYHAPQPRWKSWPGNNHFFLNGKLMFGSDLGHFAATNTMIIAPVVLFCASVAPKFDAFVALMIIAIKLALTSLALAWKTALTEPGIIPRNTSPIASEAPVLGGESAKETLAVKFCETCNIDRPPRAKHCRKCDNCVERFDHHCPWVGACLGVRNYRSFFFFVVSTLVLALFVTIVCIFDMVYTGEDNRNHDGVAGFFAAIGDHPATFLLLLYSFTGLWMVFMLFVFHAYLVSTDQTTNEVLRAKGRGGEEPVSCAQGWSRLCCEWEVPPSKLPDMQELVEFTPPPAAAATYGGDEDSSAAADDAAAAAAAPAAASSSSSASASSVQPAYYMAPTVAAADGGGGGVDAPAPSSSGVPLLAPPSGGGGGGAAGDDGNFV